jgi:hypothetical protein
MGKASNSKAVFHGSSRRLSIVAKMFLAVLAATIMLVPVLIIFLCDFSQELNAVVVGVSLVVCIVVMAVMEEVSEQALFLCVAAYVPPRVPRWLRETDIVSSYGAILVAILGNTINQKA